MKHIGETFKQLQNINLKNTRMSIPIQLKWTCSNNRKIRHTYKETPHGSNHTCNRTGLRGCLFNAITSQELGLISFHLNKIDTQTKASLKNQGPGRNTIKDEKVRNISRKHSKEFQGVGKLNKRQIELIDDTSVKAAVRHQRKIPFYLRVKIWVKTSSTKEH